MYFTIFVFCIIFVGLQKLLSNKCEIGILHPQCGDFAGGEKVLWLVLQCMQKKKMGKKIRIFCNFHSEKEEFQTKIKEHFNVDIDICDLEFQRLHLGWLIHADNYNFARLFFQYIASCLTAIEICLTSNCCYIIDTSGMHFGTVIFRLFKIPCIVYIHYPLLNVSTRPSTMLYHFLLLQMYKLSLLSSSKIIVNSTWTYKKIIKMCCFEKDIEIIYPPCNCLNSNQLIDEFDTDTINIVSLGQFRPEKNHYLQINVFSQLSDHFKNKKMTFHVIGSTRNDNDEKLFEALSNLASNNTKNENHQVIFHKNKKSESIELILSKCQYAIHTMKEEHFGIAIVEMMSRGLIIFCHASGGPREDIIKNEENGFLCDNCDEYVNKMKSLFDSDKYSKCRIRTNAHLTSLKFSNHHFTNKMAKVFQYF